MDMPLTRELNYIENIETRASIVEWSRKLRCDRESFVGSLQLSVRETFDSSLHAGAVLRAGTWSLDCLQNPPALRSLHC